MSRAMKNSGIPWIGEIPSHWDIMPHKWVMHKEKEIREKYNNETILSLTMRGVIVRDLDAGGKMPTSFDGYQVVYPNDLLQCLFDIDVTPRCVGLVKNKGLVSPAYSRFVMHSNAYSPYYDYLLRYMDDNKVLLHLSKNLRSSLTETDYGAIITCVPPIPEQHSIADFLDKKCGEIDEMISLQEKIIEELKSYKQSVITEVVCRGLNPDVSMKDSGIEWIGQIPEKWRIVRIKNILRDIGDTSSSGEGEPLSVTQNRGIIKSSEIEVANPSMSTEGWKIVRANDIVFNKYKAHSGVFFVSPYNGIVTFNYSVYRCVYGDNPKYYEYLFKTNGCISEFRKEMRGVGESISPLYTKDLFTIRVQAPPVEEQQMIVAYLNEKCSEIDTLISVNQSKIDALKEYKKSIIYEYITGKKEVEA